MSLQGHSGPYRTPFADYLSRSVTLVCDIHADFDRLVCLARALAIAKSFSRGSASIAIAAEFFWVSVMVVFMVACGLQKIYTVLQRTSTSDLGAHYLLSARSTSGISPCWRAVRGCLKTPANSHFTESANRLHPSCPSPSALYHLFPKHDHA
jgi:hypothetical protein